LDLSQELLKRGINRSFHASLLKPHVPNDDRRFPGRLPSQIPGFGKRLDEWIVESIVDHQGKGITASPDTVEGWRSNMGTLPRGSAPHGDGAILQLMGVAEPRDLPSRQHGSGDTKLTASSVRLLAERYKSEQDEREWVSNQSTLLMLSHEDLIACANYARGWRDHNLGMRPPPSGPSPPGYNEYLHLVSGGTPMMA